jgi:glycosyltransferase involved in cell wall biosynthesis
MQAAFSLNGGVTTSGSMLQPTSSLPATISYITCGPFSGINGALLPRLSAEFPDFETNTFDVAGWLRQGRRLQLEAAIAVLADAGPKAMRGRESLNRALWRSDFLYRRVGKEVRSRAAPGSFAFSFQTQSLVDGHSEGLPHFVYTDHTALTNSYYPDFEPGEVDAARVARERRIYEHAQVIFTMSGHVSRSLVEHYDVAPERVACVYAGSNIEPLPRRPDAEESQRVLFVGKDWERKGGPELVGAMQQAREVHPGASLVVAGCTPDRMPEWVEILGDLPFARIAELFAGAAILAVPTRAEPFGLVFVEALSCGVPVVASDIGAVPEIVQDGETGLLAAPGDVPALSAALVALLGDPARAHRFGALGAERMSARYTWDRVAGSIASRLRDSLGWT